MYIVSAAHNVYFCRLKDEPKFEHEEAFVGVSGFHVFLILCTPADCFWMTIIVLLIFLLLSVPKGMVQPCGEVLGPTFCKDMFCSALKFGASY